MIIISFEDQVLHDSCVELERAEQLAPVEALRAQIASIQQQISALTAQMQALPAGSDALQVATSQRSTLLAHRASEGNPRIYRFDIVMQGEGETAFLDI